MFLLRKLSGPVPKGSAVSWVPPHPAPVLCIPGLRKRSFLKRGQRGSVGFSLLSVPQEKLVNQKRGFGGHWSDSGDKLGHDHGPSERGAVVHHGKRKASHVPPTPAPQHGLRAGASNQMGWGREHTTLCPCPPAPPPIRGGARPVQSWQLPQNPHPVDRRCSARLPLAEDLNSKLQTTGCGACLTRSQERPWVQEVHPARSDPGSRWKGGLEVTQEGCAPPGGKPAVGPSLTKASPERSHKD